MSAVSTNGSGGPGNRALLSLRTGAVEAGHDGAHAAGANVCGLRTMPAVACTMRSAHAAPLTTLCSTLPAATWPWLAVASPAALLQTFFVDGNLSCQNGPFDQTQYPAK